MLPYHKVTEADRIIQSFDKFTNADVSPKVLVNHIKKLVGSETIITTDRHESVDPNDIILNAYYDPDEDEIGKRPFEVTLIFNPNDKHVCLGRDSLREFAGKLIEYLEHEMIHQSQYRSRDFRENRMYKSLAKDPNMRSKQEYLGDTDEIEAYAANLARELERKTNSYEHTMRLLRNFASTAMTRDQAGRLLSPNLYGYFQTFNFDTTHPVLKRLLKKTYHYVNQQKRAEERSARVKDRNLEIQDQTKRFEESRDSLDKNQNTKYIAIIGS